MFASSDPLCTLSRIIPHTAQDRHRMLMPEAVEFDDSCDFVGWSKPGIMVIQGDTGKCSFELVPAKALGPASESLKSSYLDPASLKARILFAVLWLN